MKKVMMFTSIDCVPCKQIKLALKTKGYNLDTIEQIFVDSDEGNKMAQEYSVHGVPTILFVEDDNVIESFCGNSPQLSDKIINWK